MQTGLTRAESAPNRRRTVALERELETYKAKQAELAAYEGKFVLIAGTEVLGVFDSHSDALNAGYKERKMEPFMVKRVSAVEMLANFTRDLRQPCIVLAQ